MQDDQDSGAIFISHASADVELVKALVELMKAGMGVPESAIFCTSLKGHGIPFGQDFNAYMKSKIQNPKLVILLITPAYLESHFCLMETGAVWSRSLNPLPIVVPPVSYSSVTRTLGLIQTWSIDDEDGLVDFRQKVLEVIQTLEPRGDHAWMQKRAEWLRRLPDLIENLQKSTMVARATHDNALKTIEAQNEAISDLEAKSDELRATITELRALKDREALKDHDKAKGVTGPEEEFNELISALSRARPERLSLHVYRHILLERSGGNPTPDWDGYRDLFNLAGEYRFIDETHNSAPGRWDSPKLRAAKEALGTLQRFLDDIDNGDFVREQEDAGTPMDLKDREFWEHHIT